MNEYKNCIHIFASQTYLKQKKNEHVNGKFKKK